MVLPAPASPRNMKFRIGALLPVVLSACSHTRTASFGMMYQSASLGTMASSRAVSVRALSTYFPMKSACEYVFAACEVLPFGLRNSNSPYSVPVGA